METTSGTPGVVGAPRAPGAQIVYLSHGGGPLPLLGDPGHDAMVAFMRRLGQRLRRPQAVLVVSAHWEERVPTVLTGPAPALYYDYYGFPEEAYHVAYPAPGAPSLARRIGESLSAGGIEWNGDPQRGFDHGAFIPLMLMYPAADIPLLQLSLVRGLDARTHVDLGRALTGLIAEDILVVGSGFSFHNLMAFDWASRATPDPQNDAFQDWLVETCAALLPQEERETRLVGWEQAPSARYAHPREEHLLPLHVCVGMAQRPGEVVFDDAILGKRSLAFLWG